MLGADPEDAGRHLRQSAIWRLRRGDRPCRRSSSASTIHAIDGLDLQDDIDGAAALSAALDLVHLRAHRGGGDGGSVGTEVWFLTAGRTWPQLGTDEYPWYADTRVLVAGEIRRLGRADAEGRRRSLAGVRCR